MCIPLFVWRNSGKAAITKNIVMRFIFYCRVMYYPKGMPVPLHETEKRRRAQ